MERKNGEIYEGYFLSNKFYAKGTLTFASDDPRGRKEYIGNFEVGYMHGRGQLFWANGDSCVGSWNYGQLKKGEVTYIWANGTKAIVTADPCGDIQFPKHLDLFFPDNDFRQEYHGQVNDKGIPHGNGTLILKDG